MRQPRGGDFARRVADATNVFCGALHVNVACHGGVSVGHVAGCRDTALHEAAARGRLPVLELLLSRGADVHAQDNKGCVAGQPAAHDAWSAHQYVTDINHRCNRAA